MSASLTPFSAGFSPSLVGTAPRESSFVKKCKTVRIVLQEAYAVFRYVLPLALAWAVKKYVFKSIKTEKITLESSPLVAFLNTHGRSSSFKIKEKEIAPLLTVHGDIAHPLTLLHLSEIARKKDTLSFSLYIPGIEKNGNFKEYNQLLEKAILAIKCFIEKKGGSFQGVVIAGHSKGAILSAHNQFVENNPNIKVTVSFGGRLNVSADSKCEETLRPIVSKVYQGIMSHSEKPLVQIVGQKDWNAPQEMMKVRPHENCYSVPGLHMSSVYTKEARQFFTKSL